LARQGVTLFLPSAVSLAKSRSTGKASARAGQIAVVHDAHNPPGLAFGIDAAPRWSLHSLCVHLYCRPVAVPPRPPSSREEGRDLKNGPLDLWYPRGVTTEMPHRMARAGRKPRQMTVRMASAEAARRGLSNAVIVGPDSGPINGAGGFPPALLLLCLIESPRRRLATEVVSRFRARLAFTTRYGSQSITPNPSHFVKSSKYSSSATRIETAWLWRELEKS